MVLEGAIIQGFSGVSKLRPSFLLMCSMHQDFVERVVLFQSLLLSSLLKLWYTRLICPVVSG